MKAKQCLLHLPQSVTLTLQVAVKCKGTATPMSLEQWYRIEHQCHAVLSLADLNYEDSFSLPYAQCGGLTMLS